MRVLLIQPPEGTTFGVSKVFLPEPLGLGLVAGALTQRGDDVRMIDMRLDSYRSLERELTKWKPEGVGIACAFTSEVIRVREVTQVVRRLAPQAFLFIGGHDATRTPTHFEKKHCDAIVIGEGEATSIALLNAYENNRTLSDVPGVAVMTEEGPIRNPGVPDYQDMSTLPLARRDLVAKYRHRYYLGFQRPVYSAETTRGCPYTCNFCSVWEMYERTYRGKSPEAVVEDLARCEGEEVFFTDDLFFLDGKRAMAMADAIGKSGIKKRFTAQIRADSVAKNPEIAKAWQSIGLVRVFIGMEAVDDEGLARVEKKAHIESTKKCIALLAEAGVEIQGSFITYPDWEKKDFDKLIDFVHSQPITFPSFSILTPLPGTKLHRESVEQILDHDPELFDVFHAVLPTKLSRDAYYNEFARLYRNAYPARRWAEMVRGAVDAWKRRDFVHMVRVVSSLSRLARASSYHLAHKHADKRAKKAGPALPAPIFSETHSRTAAERLVSLQNRKVGPSTAPVNEKTMGLVPTFAK